jgi:hypothetical protein
VRRESTAEDDTKGYRRQDTRGRQPRNSKAFLEESLQFIAQRPTPPSTDHRHQSETRVRL